MKNPLKWVENCIPPNHKMRPEQVFIFLLDIGQEIVEESAYFQAIEIGINSGRQKQKPKISEKPISLLN